MGSFKQSFRLTFYIIWPELEKAGILLVGKLSIVVYKKLSFSDPLRMPSRRHYMSSALRRSGSIIDDMSNFID